LEFGKTGVVSLFATLLLETFVGGQKPRNFLIFRGWQKLNFLRFPKANFSENQNVMDSF